MPGILLMKKVLIVTGGAGFVGANLIEFLVKKTKFKIISLDNYSSGTKENHIKNSRIKYIKANTLNISNILNSQKKKIHTIFHFGEFARIYQSFRKLNECLDSNSIGTNSVIKFCLENKIKLVYSATSATLGNKGSDRDLSPYAFLKSKNLELLNNLKKWFGFKFEIIYFYNVYGPRQICHGEMATVIGIFENQFRNKLPLTVVKPGNQTRRFTHIDDTVKICYTAWKRNKCKHYAITHKESWSVLDVAKMFKSKIKFLPERPGERYASALIDKNLNNKIEKKYGKMQLKNYINKIISK